MKRDPNVLFEGAIPENYDRYLGPVLFEAFAKDIAARLPSEDLKDVLEIACGTGILTRQLRDNLAPEVRLVATDLNPGMVAFAQGKFGANEKVEWQEADAGALSFADDSFDAVVCQFGVMFFPDKETAMRECHRVLRPGASFFLTCGIRSSAIPLPGLLMKQSPRFSNTIRQLFTNCLLVFTRPI